MEFTYVETDEQLQEAVKELSKEKEIGMDLECENNLHHYGSYLSLVQISTSKKNWIIDVLKIKNIQLLIKLIENDAINKIFHDVSFDFRVLHNEFGCNPKNIFDTQIAALLLGKEDLGLTKILEEYFQVKKERKFQKVDWTKRPLTIDMLSYAVNDSYYLIALKKKLIQELKTKDRLSWAEEEFLLLESKDWSVEESTYLSLKGAKSLPPKGLAILKRLYGLREKLAQQVDKPVHFIINTKKLLEYSEHPPHNWKKIYGVHPIVKSESNLFMEAVKLGKEEEIILPEKEHKYFSIPQKEMIKALETIREKFAKKLKIRNHLLFNKEQLKEMIINKNMASLHRWQKKLMGAEIEKVFNY